MKLIPIKSLDIVKEGDTVVFTTNGTIIYYALMSSVERGIPVYLKFYNPYTDDIITSYYELRVRDFYEFYKLEKK